MRTTTRFALPLVAVGLLLAACGDPLDIEEHVEADGVAILEGDTEIYRYMRDDGDAPELTLAQGTHDVVFVLLDDEGNFLPEEGHDDEDEEEHVLEITIVDNTTLTWTPEDHTDAHDFVEFHGELDALEPGTTTMTLCVPHGGHCDFTAEDIPVTVTAP